MKKNTIRLCLALLMIAGSMVQARIYTVCSSGCDEAEIQMVFAGNDIESGDTIEVRSDVPGGTKYYFETVTIGTNDEGEINNPVVLKARAGDKVIIDGEDTRENSLYITGDNIPLTG